MKEEEEDSRLPELTHEMHYAQVLQHTEPIPRPPMSVLLLQHKLRGPENEQENWSRNSSALEQRDLSDRM